MKENLQFRHVGKTDRAHLNRIFVFMAKAEHKGLKDYRDTLLHIRREYMMTSNQRIHLDAEIVEVGKQLEWLGQRIINLRQHAAEPPAEKFHHYGEFHPKLGFLPKPTKWSTLAESITTSA